jgi:hypothetical protein
MEGNFDYYQLYLAIPAIKVDLKMLTSTNTEPDHYPVTAYDVNNVVIGTVSSKSNFITLWNSIPGNAAVGKLSGGYGPFSFVLTVKPGQTIPAKVTVFLFIYSVEYLQLHLVLNSINTPNHGYTNRNI